ncbi:SIR2 family protein [Rufibacter ruber]|uniref:SIR2 family protein n=1 Tax=Rufibacter ruber TaxID=1783499 RepID=UPI000837082F|nr:SIR2 family protein [Rufibacter ruber]
MEEKTILTGSEFSTNETNKSKLTNLIKSGEAILMAGAGVTANLYCTWPQLVTKFEKRALQLDHTFLPHQPGEDFLAFFERVKAKIGRDHYEGLIHEEFNDRDEAYEEFHKVIVNMPFKGFTTTNYDHVLENAMFSMSKGSSSPTLFIDESINKKVILQFLKSLNDNTSARKVLHLHGSYTAPGSIILTEGEYQTKYGFVLSAAELTLLEELRTATVIDQAYLENIKLRFGLEWTMHRKLLWAILATRRVVFMGFSVTDPYFIRMLKTVREDLNTYNDDVHFAIMRITQENKATELEHAEMLKFQYGIETVFYPDDKSYTGFGRFATALGAETTVFPEPGPESKVSTEPPRTAEKHPTVNQTQSISHFFQKATAINKRIRNEDQ